jgi:FixJ family two-component response regulator
MCDIRKIVILEDDSERIREMIRCLSKRSPGVEVVTFDNARDMIEWLKGHLEEAMIICLDHDLGANRFRNGELFDPGTGRDVSDYLATRKPVCPILIHTTNSMAAPGMAMVLDDSGWCHSRVVPYCDLEWISDAWIVDVIKMIGK